MKKFAILYMATPECIAGWADFTPEDKEKDMQAWMTWMESKKDHFIDQGAPFGKNIKVTKNETANEGNGVCGYSIVRAQTHEDAVEIAKDNPHLQMNGTWIDVMECIEM